jgi:Holliday junction DNA helicase RuvA
MIGFLKGTLVRKQPPWLTLDVGGVGYELEAPMSTFYGLPDIGSGVTLVTHLHVREDAHTLYGFSDEAERGLFRNLLKVSGIGAKIALGILSGMTVDGFYKCVRDKDLLSLTRIPGVGRKTAERLLVEMADRMPAFGSEVEAAVNGKGASETEARSALVNLGYKPAEVAKMLGPLDVSSLSAEEIIREALRQAHGT